MTFGWRTRWADFIRIWSSELAAAIFTRKHMLRWSPLTSTRDRVSRRESEKRPGTGEWATGGRQKTRTARATGGGRATSAATARRAYRQTDGQRGGRQRCICQVVGDEQVVRQPRWVPTNVRRSRGQTDEFYHYSEDSSAVWSVKQWNSNRAVGWLKTDDSSRIRSENTAGGNGPSIELSHGRLVACHKINFHIKPEKGGRFIQGSCIFLQFGLEIWGSTYMCSRLVRNYIR